MAMDRTSPPPPFADVDSLLAALSEATGFFDEPDVDVLSHSLQTAEILARSRPDDPELVIAGLLHDIADAVAPGRHAGHEEVGAALVRPLFGDTVADLVAGHVAAKRYLAAGAHALSSRSRETLVDQGGAMTAAERAIFEESPLFDRLIALRVADDQAKDPGAVARPLSAWRPLLDSLSGFRGSRAG